jgi:flagellar basal body-associated protein FliL
MEFPNRGCLSFLLLAAIAAATIVLLLACGQRSGRVVQGTIAQQHGSQQQSQDGTSNKPIPGVYELDGHITVNRAVSAESTVASQRWHAGSGQSARRAERNRPNAARLCAR